MSGLLKIKRHEKIEMNHVGTLKPKNYGKKIDFLPVFYLINIKKDRKIKKQKIQAKVKNKRL